MKESSNIRALVVGDEPEDAEHLISVMRSAGYTVNAIRVDEAEPMQEAIAKNEVDIALHSLGTMDVKLSDTVSALQNQNLFVPVLAMGNGDLTPGKAMAEGAADRITPDDDEHLKFAVLREFQRVLARREVHLLNEAYTESEKRARALMQTSRDAIAYIHDGMHVLANDAYLARFGYASYEELEHMPFMDMVSGGDEKTLREMLRASATSEQAVGKLELELQRADESTFKAEVEFSRASIEGEACTQIIIRDKGDTKELAKHLSRLSQRDNVTGLYNRQFFLKRLTEIAEQAEQDEIEAALLQISLDDFASVRSRVGVIGSDQVVADIGKVLRNACSKEDLLARLDGPTFGLITPISDRGALEKLATSIREAVKEHICDVENTSISVTASIGIARIDASTSDPNDILNRAERAWSEAAEKGGNSHTIYEPKPGEMSQKEIDQQWIEEIKETLKNDRLQLLYQPIVSLQEDETERYEVIVQMFDSEGNLEDMDELLAAAERTGMSRGIDRWVLLNGLKALVDQRKKHSNTSFFIPLSGQALEDPSLFRWVHERLKKLKLPEKSVVFQIDTAATATRIKQAAAFGKAVRTMGCQISLSRFGHGKDPFQVTKHIPADYLKLNEEFMHELGDNEQNQEAIKKITSEARSAKILSVCPAVDDAGALTVLWGLGADLIQGSFLQEPSAELEYDFSSMSM